ncbi:predicted protein [Postia placenta Mad-698-R]|nr:predicted protein [Postia placenta Mad-698-R]
MDTEEIQHYSLNDIQFNPTVFILMYSARQPGETGVCGNRPEAAVTYSCVMGAVLFKPKEALLAMAGWDGNVYLYADAMSAPTKSRLRVAPVSNQEISGLLWGRDASSSMLFASTMTRYEQDFLGYHRAYDATTRQIVCEYKIDEAGEQLAVEESGTRLIISTRRSKRAHSLWLFDARTRDTRPIDKVDMLLRGAIT